MKDRTYRLRYLLLFEQDLIQTVDYITNVLLNPDSASQLVNDTELSIKKRLLNPEAFEVYPSLKKRLYPYYRIYVHNYVVYYTVIDDVMEIRRFLYKGRDTTCVFY